MDRCIRGSIGRTGHIGICWRHRRECAHCSFPNLRGTRISWNRLEEKQNATNEGVISANASRGCSPRHSYRRGMDDRTYGLSRPWILEFKKGEEYGK